MKKTFEEQQLSLARRLARFTTLYADPPWWEAGGGQIQRGANKYYPLMKTSEICELKVWGVPVADLCGPNSHLYLWATNNFLEDAFEVGKAWGYRYITTVTWYKAAVEQKPRDTDSRILTPQKPGLGQYFRGQTEHCLFFLRGRIPYRQLKGGKRAQGRTILISPRREHSQKPEEMRHMIETVSPGPYLELFAAEKAKGWSSWGPQSHREKI